MNMKTTFLSIGLALMLVMFLNLNESGAEVATVETQQQFKDGTVTGIYEGYINQTIIMQLKDGTRISYPFKSDKSLLVRISRTRLATPVVITIKSGNVVSFEEVSR
jgi:hypothetical protein